MSDQETDHSAFSILHSPTNCIAEEEDGGGKRAFAESALSRHIAGEGGREREREWRAFSFLLPFLAAKVAPTPKTGESRVLSLFLERKQVCRKNCFLKNG